MTHDELRWAINSVAEQPACETVGHWSSAKALRAVVELHRPEEIRNLSGDLLESQVSVDDLQITLALLFKRLRRS